MNPRLLELQPYPFERLRALLTGLAPKGTPIRLSIGEPQHRTPDFISRALGAHLDGLSVYPATAGLDRLREAIAASRTSSSSTACPSGPTRPDFAPAPWPATRSCCVSSSCIARMMEAR